MTVKITAGLFIKTDELFVIYLKMQSTYNSQNYYKVRYFQYLISRFSIKLEQARWRGVGIVKYINEIG